jgi:discoidin domain receptor family protein 2
MPQGDQRGAGWQFYDASYDGIWDGSLLRQGLGQLTDGKLGPDNFKASYYDQDRGKDKRKVPVYFPRRPRRPRHL